MPSHGILLPTRASVQSSSDRPTLTARTAGDVVGLAQRIEALGFESVWVGDSVLAKPRHEPLTTLSAVAAATEAVELGTSVYLPPLRDPVHIAHQAATLDQLSGVASASASAPARPARLRDPPSRTSFANSASPGSDAATCLTSNST
jgi:hypothetical protein